MKTSAKYHKKIGIQKVLLQNFQIDTENGSIGKITLPRIKIFTWSG